MEQSQIFAIFLPIVGLIVFRLVAGGNIPIISPIARFIWNLSCWIGSHVPFIGWICAKLMIEKSESDTALKTDAVQAGEEADDWGAELAAQSLARSQEEQRRIEEQAELERRISKETGKTAHIHGNTVDIGNKTFDLNEVKKELNIS